MQLRLLHAISLPDQMKNLLGHADAPSDSAIRELLRVDVFNTKLHVMPLSEIALPFFARHG